MSSEDRYRKFFVEADTDNSGSLSLSELTAALRKGGYTESDAKIKKMFDAVDDSGDCQISLDEYLTAMGLLPEKDHKAAMMRRVFRQFDKNGDGQIDRTELKEVFVELGYQLPPSDIDSIIRLADRDGSQSLDYNEFVRNVFGEQS
jgi:Ca2+-binding EF-hand superfamily protein